MLGGERSCGQSRSSNCNGHAVHSAQACRPEAPAAAVESKAPTAALLPSMLSLVSSWWRVRGVTSNTQIMPGLSSPCAGHIEAKLQAYAGYSSLSMQAGAGEPCCHTVQPVPAWHMPARIYANAIPYSSAALRALPPTAAEGRLLFAVTWKFALGSEGRHTTHRHASASRHARRVADSAERLQRPNCCTASCALPAHPARSRPPRLCHMTNHKSMAHAPDASDQSPGNI